MKKHERYLLFVIYLLGTLCSIYILGFILFQPDWINDIITDWSFWAALILYIITTQEFLHWARVGRRSELSDFVFIAFFFFLIFFFTKDLMTSIMGSFSIYLWVGIFELKEYPVLNKILVISLVTYNIIFVAGLISFYLEDPIFVNTAFSFSFWIILVLGFIMFGRKYIVVWRFMSPAYLTLFLYIIAWLGVVLVNQYTPLNFVEYIYFVLIAVNWLIYFVSGPILDKILGIKSIDDKKILNIVENVKNDIGIKTNVKVGFGKYPILNAMAYGAVFDKRIAIIAEDMNQIPEDELKGIVAHELSHIKGNHTLILTFISTGDLLIRMFLGIPATYYDYTFGNPRIPMIVFIFLNFGIYIFLFIFVRILEGKADLMTRKAGYANELTKALYNLESFYATGREIGLNTMLLCDEKITKNNKLLDYYDTATYINRSMINPSRGSLLGNFINSHPPTYHRIAAILGDELKPGKEALLPFICLKKSKQKKYAQKFEKPRKAFKMIANEKFKDLFDVDNISQLLKSLKLQEIYKFEIKKDYIFQNKITDEMMIGKLEEIQFLDDITESTQYMVTNLKTNEKYSLNASLYKKTEIQLDKIYFLRKNSPLLLNDINFTENNKMGYYNFLDEEKNEIKKRIKKTRLPNSVDIVNSLNNRDVFLKMKGNLKIFKCVKVIPAYSINNYELELTPSNENSVKDLIRLKLNDIIIRPKSIYFSPRKNSDSRKSEANILNWLLNNHLLSSIYLKKPVNNLEIGYIKTISVGFTNGKNDENFVIVKNIFGEKKLIPYHTIELISFDYNSVTIQKKSETSVLSRLGYKILKKFYPQKVLCLNKV